MNREQRRKAAKSAGLRGRDRQQGLEVREDACQLCTFITNVVIGKKASQFTLADGSEIPLPPNKALARGQGIRFPKSNESAQLCLPCSNYVLGWLRGKQDSYEQESGKRSKIIVPGVGEALTGRILRP